MLKVVVDTNILVSALWTPEGNASSVVRLILTDKIIPCFDERIIHEYRTVLSRPKLSFSGNQVDSLLEEITVRGIMVFPLPGKVKMPDETDRKFYDTAKYCEAYLFTGNLKHYPKDSFITSPAGFLNVYNRFFQPYLCIAAMVFMALSYFVF